MKYNFNNDVKLFMVFDILGDTERTGPLLWHIDRKRLEDVQNHILNLLLIARILKKYFPSLLDYDKINDYIICHDLPEAITGDITKFEGVSEVVIKRVTNLAIDYLVKKFNNVLDLNTYIHNFENKVDIESKVVYMIDKVHSSLTFIKYQSEKNVDMNDYRIIPELRNLPFVAERIEKGKDLADIFFEYHMRSVNITDEECKLYNISREDADSIVNAIKGFASEVYNQKLNGTLFEVKASFPKESMIYNRNNQD